PSQSYSLFPYTTLFRSFWYSLEGYREAGRHLIPASVSVSGYSRRDGTYVRPYHRRPPGGVSHDAPYERIRSNCQGGMFFGAVISDRKSTRLNSSHQIIS